MLRVVGTSFVCFQDGAATKVKRRRGKKWIPVKQEFTLIGCKEAVLLQVKQRGALQEYRRQDEEIQDHLRAYKMVVVELKKKLQMTQQSHW